MNNRITKLLEWYETRVGTDGLALIAALRELRHIAQEYVPPDIWFGAEQRIADILEGKHGQD